MKLVGFKQIKGEIIVITGLHIGAGNAIIEIGGKDNPVIKHPLTKEPYIPGSSLKGKMRSLLEWSFNLVNTDSKDKRKFGNVHQWCGNRKCPICVIFGTSADDADLGPTRLLVRDACLSKSYKKELKIKNLNWTAGDITESKSENFINRITARANPRNFERVISGARFSLEMVYRVFANDNDKAFDDDLFSNVLYGLRLIEMDAIGGAGSRGCGQVRFEIKVDRELTKSLDQVTTNDFPTIPYRV